MEMRPLRAPRGQQLWGKGDKSELGQPQGQTTHSPTSLGLSIPREGHPAPRPPVPPLHPSGSEPRSRRGVRRAEQRPGGLRWVARGEQGRQQGRQRARLRTAHAAHVGATAACAAVTAVHCLPVTPGTAPRGSGAGAVPGATAVPPSPATTGGEKRLSHRHPGRPGTPGLAPTRSSWPSFPPPSLQGTGPLASSRLPPGRYSTMCPGQPAAVPWILPGCFLSIPDKQGSINIPAEVRAAPAAFQRLGFPTGNRGRAQAGLAGPLTGQLCDLGPRSSPPAFSSCRSAHPPSYRAA